MKSKIQTVDLQMWPWPWVDMIEICFAYSLTDVNIWLSLMKILPVVKAIWSGREIKGSNLWPSIVTLILSQHVESWVLFIVSLSQIFDQNFMKIFPGVKEIWSRHKIKGSNSWPWPRVSMLELWVLHIISLRRTFDQNLMKIFSGVKEIWSGQTIRLKLVTFNCDLDLESVWLSNEFCTSSHWGKHLTKD